MENCTHNKMTATMHVCPDCGFECEHDSAFWETEDEGVGVTEFWGQVSNDVQLVTRCSRDGVDVTELREYE